MPVFVVALTLVPGITAHQGENNRDQLVIRGNSTSADFFVNGVRDDVQYYRDLYNLERIEALKGPNAMMFGRGGAGGVINRVTKQAGFGSARELSLQTGDVRQQAGDRRHRRGGERPHRPARERRCSKTSDSFRDAVGSAALRRDAEHDDRTGRTDADHGALRVSARSARCRSRHPLLPGAAGRGRHFHVLRQPGREPCRRGRAT